MNFSDAKDAIRTGFLEAGLALDSEDSESLSFTHEASPNPIQITKAIISDYASVGDNLGFYTPSPEFPEVTSLGYREVRVGNTEGGLLYSSDPNFVFGDKSSGDPYVEIGNATTIFWASFLYSRPLVDYYIGRFSRNKRFDLHRYLTNIQTARVGNLGVMSDDRLTDETNNIIDSSFFDLSYDKGLTLSRINRWPKSSFAMMSGIEEDEDDEDTDVSYPNLPPKYNIDLTRFYRRVISYDPYIQFLSFYHVAEHYFLEISDKNLYKRMQSILNDRKFRATKPDLDRLIQSVSDHKAESREEEMLKGVLAEFLDENDLIAKMASIEKAQAEKIYTSKSTCFGYELDKMTLQKSHVFGPLSKRIKTIRNALVHSSDRHERKAKYVPGEEANIILRREIPLMQYIAEKIIIGDSQARSL